ncbi:hypothetical protein [Rhizobium ruizarguesonis]|uniref:hypothetical protein n=1 Tax=Rhizobium ruizarguesonis TaxID=2081791 RepID=UPI001031CC4E|nr:hypothetical protein [Rhizobium ruizarguesonis]TBF08694.1 hypothetical protein ELG96_08210 [Rhizobium ruizarguesonis]
MVSITVPLRITYDTKGATPVVDIIAALEAADSAIQDAISLLPSLISGLNVERSEINVHSLTQQSPLRELFGVSLILAFQDDLTKEIPPMLEDIFKIKIPESYDSVVTVVTMIVIFYGASFLRDAAVKSVQDNALRRQVDALISQLAATTGRTESDVRKVFDAKYSRPGPVKRLAKTVGGFFAPSQREGAVPVLFDRQEVGSEVIREVPYPREFSAKEDFERYDPYSMVVLEIHAQDKDKANTGWAAVPKGISEKRLRMKLMEPVTAMDLWARDQIRADVTIISHLTANGYDPAEIHVTRVYD